MGGSHVGAVVVHGRDRVAPGGGKNACPHSGCVFSKKRVKIQRNRNTPGGGWGGVAVVKRRG